MAEPKRKHKADRQSKSKFNILGFKAEFINQPAWLIITVTILGVITLISITFILLIH